MTRRIALLIVVAVGLLVTGCQGEDQQLLIDLALEWARENAVDIGAYTLLGRSGNDEVDAVMEARGVISNINGADQLMEQGRADGDLGKMQEAVELRPGDYTYRATYSTALLRSGDLEESRVQLEWGRAAAEDSPEAKRRFAEQGIAELEAMGPELVSNGFESKEQCEEYYFQMRDYYLTLEALEPDGGYGGQVVFAGQELNACGQQFVSP